jgi:hypothetical protein
MASSSAHPAGMISLRELVERYLAAVGEFGKPAPLTAFGLPTEQTERVFSSYDEDYHISRYFHFSEAAEQRAGKFSVNGVPVTHVSLDAEIQTIL